MHYHLIGIGGIGMSGIAQLLLKRKIEVSGSDLRETRTTQELKNLGAAVFIGHSPSNIEGADLIIYSSAITSDNPEIQAAKAKNIPLIKRAQALADLMRDETVITVAGSHGKTTTSSLAAYLLLQAGFSPTVAIGGIFRNINNNARLGEGRFFVAEADESDASFLYYNPHYSIVTNIDYEHLDYYKDFNNVISAYREFVNKTQSPGCVFCCSDDANLKDILKDYKKRYVLFGLDDSAHIYPKNIVIKGLTCEFDCFYQDKFTRPLAVRAGFIERFRLNLGGMHNISNALSVIALGLELGIGLEVIKGALANYQGTLRRIEIKFNNDDYLVVDDYAHHPTEIRATLAAVRSLRPRVIAVFQPHRYTRTKLLLDEFGKCFDLADCIIVTDIYPASEPPLEGISGRAVYDRIKEGAADKQVYFLPKAEIAEYILKITRPNDLIITLGAGDITKISDELAQRFKNKD